MSARPGVFITFEGGEGAGKSTQATLLAQRLRAAGRTVLLTREPGGAPAAEAIRDLLVRGEPGQWDMHAEALLHFAARRMHLVRTVWPALERGEWVLCDRFVDSSMAYQGLAGGLGSERITALAQWTMADFAPDLTLVLDIEPEQGLARSARRQGAGGEDRYERMGLAFHRAVAAAFRRIAEENPERCRLLPADGDIEVLAGRIWTLLLDRFGSRQDLQPGCEPLA